MQELEGSNPSRGTMKKMKVKPYKLYIKYEGKLPRLKIEYDKISKKRPAWIFIKGLKSLPSRLGYITFKINNGHIKYMSFLKSPLFIPINYQKKEMEMIYDKFSLIYDQALRERNIGTAEFLLKKIGFLPKNAEILDLGAGSGLSSLPFVKAGYSNITLVEFSKKMLSVAKKRKEFKNCKFIKTDIRKIKLKKKFDLILSINAFATEDYFDEKEMPNLWKKIAALLKPEGKLILLGNDFEPAKTLFKKLRSGKYDITKADTKKGILTKWCICTKRA